MSILISINIIEIKIKWQQVNFYFYFFLYFPHFFYYSLLYFFFLFFFFLSYNSTSYFYMHIISLFSFIKYEYLIYNYYVSLFSILVGPFLCISMLYYFPFLLLYFISKTVFFSHF